MAKKSIKWVVGLVLLAAVGGGYLWMREGTAPTETGPSFYIRYERPAGLPFVLRDLKNKGVIRDPSAFRVYALLTRRPSQVGTGTYQLHPGMSASAILQELQKPVKQMVRIPETNWGRRTANLLEQRYDVCPANDYLALMKDPGQFSGTVSFPLPKTSLEGYLYPDTYDLPPLLGAKAVITRQLRTFEDKVWNPLKPADLERTLVVASLVELESGRDEERPMIAGVIENRLARKMRLQIDASLLYGIQKWRRLTFADYKNLDTPYNTYTHDGLPPGPICSPSIRSIEAALHPAKHNYLYYVASPVGTLFAATYPEHLKNIKKAKALRKAQGALGR